MTINRSLSRNLSIVAVGVLLVALFSVYLPVAHAAAFVVDSTSDTSDFSTGDGFCDTNDSVGDGPCTLRAALEQANALTGTDSITFSTTGIINVGSQLIASDAVSISATTLGDIRIIASTSRNLVIGFQRAPNPGPPVEVFPTFSVTLNNLIIASGTGSGNVAGAPRSEGGCIFVAPGNTLTLNGSVVRNCNSTSKGGGIYGDGGAGGSGASTVNLYDLTTVRNNRAAEGGGVYSLTGTMRVQDAACVRNNVGTAYGGGIYGGDDTYIAVGGGAFAEQRGFIVSNRAAQGGGIYMFLNSSFDGNNARLYSNTTTGAADWGGAYFSQGGDTGAISGVGRQCTSCCIVGNNALDNYAVYQDINGLASPWKGNWWGNNWGPRMNDAAPLTGSNVSNGDGINQNGTGIAPSRIDVGILTYGTHSVAPTGDWLVNPGPPSVPSDCQAFVCNPTSSVAPGTRSCNAPTSCGIPDTDIRP